jgi:hypothetical protein
MRECRRVHRRLMNDHDRIGATPVSPTPPFKLRIQIGEAGAASTHMEFHTGRTLARKTKGGPSWMGAPCPWRLMRMALQSWPRQPQLLAKTVGPTKPLVSELSTSPLVQCSSPTGQKIPMRGRTAVAARSIARSIARSPSRTISASAL